MGGMHPYNDNIGIYPQFAHSTPGQPNVYDMRSSQVAMPHHQYTQSQMFSNDQTQPLGTAESDIYTEHDQSTAENLSEVLGELKIDETGIAPYIRQQRRERAEPEIPTQDEVDEKLPPLSTGAGATIRIPPELMPSDDEVMNYFKIYFDDIHPYVPVIHRSHLYYQWQHERSSISPLLLEALFACAGRLSDDPAQGAQWLALANRHESSFMDEPRLSTIQALLLLLKARESRPKKGYYYRSWQTVKTIISMAKDLDIHEHNNLHTEGRSCDLNPVECLVQTRVWQALLVVEVMIGAPQGRSDYGVDHETVNMSPTLDIRGLDQFELDRSRQYAYFVRNARHIRIIADIYHKIKKQKDWGANPKFVEKNPLFTDWLQSLPPDLQVNYPPDGSPPWIPSHFVGNMHSHCHLDANATEDSAASSAAGRPSAQTRRNNIPPANLNIRNVNHERPRPRRIIDARSLAASQATGQPANILKNSRARNPRGNRSTAFRGPRAGPRKKVQSKDGREGRPRRNEGSDQEDSAFEAAFHEASINAVYRELAEQAQPKPVQYNPESISLASLKETWPSLPTDIHAHTAGVVEKLSLFGDRYANDYVPPNELGKRLYQGKFVRFSSEEEKAEAIMEANKLSQERADKLSQRKGDLVEPRHVNFSPLSTKDQGSLIGLLVQGNYPKSKAKQADNVSVVDSVSENLRNNATYHTVGKSSAFIAKLDSLLAASRITKRS
ncbi:hypothetical protein CAN33_0052210 [Aspergillus niger]|uniref:Xylanolytic transcriptional activator regulatory domain-containing protein n=1 Tax=Aspergillus niger TaxID=5061 RepID=A0A505I8A3_ASPNG|nr:hypothetical protein CAN33_0052210 [Aspergillus niger]